jgi:hypothetical protein
MKINRLTQREVSLILLFIKYCSGDPVKDMMDRICSTHGEKINAYKIFVGKHEGKRPFWRRVDNIKMYIKETGCKGVRLIKLARNRVSWQLTLKNPCVP